MKNLILEAVKVIANSDALFITAGAGIGVDSGLPDFRGDEGFWKAYPLLKEQGLSFIDLANPAWFSDSPQRAWGFYGHRFQLYKKTIPHEGFSILKKWSENKETFIFTSNVDGHFQKKLFPDDSIYECHGSINYLQCNAGCFGKIWPLVDLDIEVDENTLMASGDLPKCPKCDSIARPNILMFEDYDWKARRAIIQRYNYENWKIKNQDKKIVVVELGAGKAIPTVRHVSQSMPGKLVRINPRDSDGLDGTISIALGSLEALKAIDILL
ncbi:MAG: Sir2 family NAD-dependent protein deacetylase [Candidatus Marithrix sp.]